MSGVIYEEELIGLDSNEKAAFKEIRGDLSKQMETLLNLQFKTVTRLSADQFYSEVSRIIESLDKHIKQSEYNVNKYLQEMNKWYGEGKNLPPANAHNKAYLAAVEAIKEMSNSIHLRTLEIEAFNEMTHRFLAVIDEVKNLELEKMK